MFHLLHIAKLNLAKIMKHGDQVERYHHGNPQS